MNNNESKEFRQYDDTEEIECSETEVDYLQNSIFKKRNCIHIKYSRPQKDGKIRLRVNCRQYVGIIGLDGNQPLRFKPRFGEELLPLLKYVKSLENNDLIFDENRPVKMEKGIYFFDIIGFLFCNQLKEVMERGILKKYLIHEDNMAYLKGKLLFRDHVKQNSFKQNRFYCAYDDITFDNLENQSVLYALSCLTKLVSAGNKNLLKELHYYLAQIQDEITHRVIEPHELEHITFNRINEHYEELLKTSKIIIESIYYKSISSEESMGYSFLVDMNKIFQQTVTGLLEEILIENHPGYELRSEKRIASLVKDESIKIRPDILIKGPKNVLVIDTKYKKEDRAADYYQIIAYVIALKDIDAKCHKGCLIYPSCEDKKDIKRTLYTSLSDELEMRDEKFIFTEYLNMNTRDKYIENLRIHLKNILKCLLKGEQIAISN